MSESPKDLLVDMSQLCLILPKLLEPPPLGGHSRRRSLLSDLESSLDVSFWRPRHSESAPRHQVRQFYTFFTETDPRRMWKGHRFPLLALAHMAVIFEPLSVVFVSSSHLPLSCFGSSGGHRTATRAEKSFFPALYFRILSSLPRREGLSPPTN